MQRAILASRGFVRCAAAPSRTLATQAPSATSVTTPDPEHQAWLQAVRKYPVAIPHFEWTLEWMLSTPFPLHQFTQSPIVIEVKDRNPNADALLYRGPNVVGGYPHPETGVTVTEESHVSVVSELNKKASRPNHEGSCY